MTSQRPGRGLFYRIRVAVLLAILAGVLLYAYRDVHSRRRRAEWSRSLSVALVVVREGPVGDAAIRALSARVPALEDRLREEMARRRDASMPPIVFTVVGPVDAAGAPPEPPAEAGILAAARYQWDLDRWVAGVDARTGTGASRYDSRIYLVAHPPVSSTHEEIEGASEQGGRVGVVRVELDASMADFALFVAVHELFHTLGATDKYAPDGSILVPEGLPEPDRSPLYPQVFTEVMARHRAVGPGRSKPPESIDELAVGAQTAQEIGWTR
jgi:hypothetical protein